MSKIQTWTIIIFVVIILVASFYWFEWRPSQIRKECALIVNTNFPTPINEQYQNCIELNGIAN